MKIITNTNELPNMTVDEISKLDIAIGGDALLNLVNGKDDELECEIKEKEVIIDRYESIMREIKDLADEISELTDD